MGGGNNWSRSPLAPWASRRRHDLLELLDRLRPTIAQLSQTIEQEVEKYPEARGLMTHPGVGPLTALAVRADHRNSERHDFTPTIGLEPPQRLASSFSCSRTRSAFPVVGRESTVCTFEKYSVYKTQLTLPQLVLFSFSVKHRRSPVFILRGPATPIRIDNGRNRTIATFVEVPCTQRMTSSTSFFSTSMPTGSWTR